MRPEILALFIPIVFLVGLFTAISLHIYYKYKARVATAEHAQGESLDAWCRAEAMARASVSRSASLRVGGFLTGAGIGTALGMLVGASDSMWIRFGHLFDWNGDGGQLTLCLLCMMAGAMLIGGVGMIGAWLLDRVLEGKKSQVKQL